MTNTQDTVISDMPVPFRFVPLGVGDAFSERHYSSAVAVQCSDVVVMLECPHPIMKMIHENGRAVVHSLQDVDYWIITHLHGDHASGIDTAAHYYRTVLNRQMQIWANDAVLDDLWATFQAALRDTAVERAGQWVHQYATRADYFKLRALPRRNVAEITSEIQVASQPGLHVIPTTQVKIYYNGKCLAYSSDTQLDPDRIEWLYSNADVVIHEAGQHGPHTRAEELLELVEQYRARTYLIHYPDDADGFNEYRLQEGRVYDVA